LAPVFDVFGAVLVSVIDSTFPVCMSSSTLRRPLRISRKERQRSLGCDVE
jgi:hypothetical protein